MENYYFGENRKSNFSWEKKKTIAIMKQGGLLSLHCPQNPLVAPLWSSSSQRAMRRQAAIYGNKILDIQLFQFYVTWLFLPLSLDAFKSRTRFKEASLHRQLRTSWPLIVKNLYQDEDSTLNFLKRHSVIPETVICSSCGSDCNWTHLEVHFITV